MIFIEKWEDYFAGLAGGCKTWAMQAPPQSNTSTISIALLVLDAFTASRAASIYRC